MVFELPYENYESEESFYEGLESGVIERSDSAFITIPVVRADGDEPGFAIAKPAPLSDAWYELVGVSKT